VKFAFLLALAALALAEQPLPYSHKTHLGLGLKCQECHVNPEPGDKMTFPATSRCMACHRTIAADKPAIRKLADFATKNEAIAWERIYSVSAGIYWSHRAHLEAGAKCERCHGEVSQMDTVTVVNDVVSMAGCVACHREAKAPTGCNACHDER
jgi:hypothetical protein